MPYKDPEKAKAHYREYHQKNKEKRNAYDKEYARIHREEKDAKRMESYYSNLEHEKYVRDLYHEAHKDEEWYKAMHTESTAKWQANNPEKVKDARRKRRAIQANVNEHYTVQDERYTLDLFSHKCFNCGKIDGLCVDHVYPLSRGFALTRQNACILCNSCNNSKHNKWPENFYSLARLVKLFQLLGINPLCLCPDL